jgi:hypothetical protein
MITCPDIVTRYYIRLPHFVKLSNTSQVGQKLVRFERNEPTAGNYHPESLGEVSLAEKPGD